jgi:hypothetical protein
MVVEEGRKERPCVCSGNETVGQGAETLKKVSVFVFC